MSSLGKRMLGILAAWVLVFFNPTANAAEFNSFSPTPHVWHFQSPAGNLSDEPSGLAASRRNPGSVFWENEAPRSGMGMVYAVNAAGLQKTLKFTPTGSMFDFEDMSLGPCDGPGSSNCLWVGDIGRLCADFSAAKKNTFWLYRMAEPDLSAIANGTTLPVTGRYGFTLPSSITAEPKKGGSASTYDMEALMVHPKTGDIFVVTKGQNTAGLIRILQYPMPLSRDTVKQLQIVKTFQMPRASTWNPATLAGEGEHLVTGGDIHPDGRRFVLRTYGKFWEFRGGDFAAALASTTPVKLPKAGGSLDMQGEAFTYSPDGGRYFSIGEKSSSVTRSLVYFDHQ